MTGTAAALPPIASTRESRVSLTRLLPWLAGIIVFAVGALIVDGVPVGAIRDDSMYVLLAKALATGHGYHWLHLPGTPAATHFPPGYPAVLAVLWWLYPSFPANVIVFKLANVLFSALAASGVARLATRRLGMSEIGAQSFAIVTLLGAPTLGLTTHVMSEPLFLALLIPTLLLAEAVLERPHQRIRDPIVLGLLVGALTLVRTNGIALVAAVLLLFVRRRYRDAAVFGVVAAALLLPWQMWVGAHAGTMPAPMRGNYESYGSWLAAGIHDQGIGLLARTALRTTTELALMFQHLVAPSLPALIRLPAFAMLVALSSIGARTFWRRAPVSAVFLALYSIIVILWPYTPGRFIWGIWPLIVLLPVLGVRDVLAWRPVERWARVARLSSLGAAALLACGYATYNVKGYMARTWSTRSYANYLRPLLVWVASHTPRDALLASEAEGTVHLYTGRPTVPVGSFTINDYFVPRGPVENAAIMRTMIDRYHPRVVVVSAGWMRAAARELALSQPPVLAVVDTFPGGVALTPTQR